MMSNFSSSQHCDEVKSASLFIFEIDNSIIVPSVESRTFPPSDYVGPNVNGTWSPPRPCPCLSHECALALPWHCRKSDRKGYLRVVIIAVVYVWGVAGVAGWGSLELLVG